MYFQHNARMAFAKYAIRPGPSTKYTTATVSKKGFIALVPAAPTDCPPNLEDLAHRCRSSSSCQASTASAADSGASSASPIRPDWNVPSFGAIPTEDLA